MSEIVPSPLPGGTGEIALFQTDDGRTRVECRLVEGSLWLSQALMAELFGKNVKTINEHVVNIYDEAELAPDRTIRKFRIVRSEGGRDVARTVEHYNLEAIMAVGFRVRSHVGTLFRQWALGILREYVTKGFAMDDARLKNPAGPDAEGYFEELLERVRDIRSSERVLYRKVLDIYATSVDYDPSAEASREFFAKVQNKLHYAAHGHTAAEVVVDRADGTLPLMGMTARPPGGRVTLAEAKTAKNYLTAEELSTLNLIVSGYLDIAELRAKGRQPMRMADWSAQLDGVLTLGGRDLLAHAGRVTAKQAELHAAAELAKHRRIEDAKPRPVDTDLEAALELLTAKGTRRRAGAGENG